MDSSWVPRTVLIYGKLTYVDVGLLRTNLESRNTPTARDIASAYSNIPATVGIGPQRTLALCRV
jgi:hypothetical protein